ncbi:ATPase, T2SS/T4P/T4SS family [Blastococcus sp. VKM Ac-2987]|nr:ATPase, T2SS/T4P/T4SS family [Blastococcus sp. VKM Ac-2987]MCZ2857824.1 ATPase, T2SS/T4P/T4SS family [Blastococcus sp. VKM Ac-2987]
MRCDAPPPGWPLGQCLARGGWRTVVLYRRTQLSRPRPPHLCSSPPFEARVPLPDVVSMQTRQPNLEGAGEIPLRRLVKEALRMRPSRIVVGEVRQEECLDLSESA